MTKLPARGQEATIIHTVDMEGKEHMEGMDILMEVLEHRHQERSLGQAKTYSLPRRWDTPMKLCDSSRQKG